MQSFEVSFQRLAQWTTRFTNDDCIRSSGLKSCAGGALPTSMEMRDRNLSTEIITTKEHIPQRPLETPNRTEINALPLPRRQLRSVPP